MCIRDSSEINALLAGSADDELKGKYHEVLSQLPAMKELYGHRARLRKALISE